MKKHHGGNLREINDRYGKKPYEVLDFSANINPLGFPPYLKELVFNSFENVSNYPDPESRLLKKKISSILLLSEESIIPGNGSDELMFLALRALSPKKVLIPAPSYIEYEHAAHAAGASCSFIKAKARNGFKISVANINKKLAGTELLLICNPNNPTGFLMEREKVLFLAKELQNLNAFLIIDEAFIDFLENPGDFTLIPFLKKFKNIIILRSLTKFFAVPGLRIGYAAADPLIIRNMEKLQQTWPLNCFAQIAGKAVLEDKDFIIKSREYILSERLRFYSRLSEIKWLKPFKPTANFILCSIKFHGLQSSELLDFLIKEHNILIRDCSNFRGLEKNYFRLAVKSSEDNDKLINALVDFEKRKL
ncbi:MAG: threonine-phosphate decarboxylase CobD [Candidatus Humimicrobiaceae bacterium]